MSTLGRRQSTRSSYCSRFYSLFFGLSSELGIVCSANYLKNALLEGKNLTLARFTNIFPEHQQQQKKQQHTLRQSLSLA